VSEFPDMLSPYELLSSSIQKQFVYFNVNIARALKLPSILNE